MRDSTSPKHANGSTFAKSQQVTKLWSTAAVWPRQSLQKKVQLERSQRNSATPRCRKYRRDLAGARQVVFTKSLPTTVSLSGAKRGFFPHYHFHNPLGISGPQQSAR
jgi:hypothetical protein